MVPSREPSTSPAYPTEYATFQPSTVPLQPTPGPSLFPSFSPHAHLTSFSMCGTSVIVDSSLSAVTGKFPGSITFMNATTAEFSRSSVLTALADTIECILPTNHLLLLPEIDLKTTQSATNATIIFVQFTVTFTVSAANFESFLASATTSNAITTSEFDGVDLNVYEYYNISSHILLKAISNDTFATNLQMNCKLLNCSIASVLLIKTSASIGALSVVESPAQSDNNGSKIWLFEIITPIAVVFGILIFCVVTYYGFARDMENLNLCSNSNLLSIMGKPSGAQSATHIVSLANSDAPSNFQFKVSVSQESDFSTYVENPAFARSNDRTLDMDRFLVTSYDDSIRESRLGFGSESSDSVGATPPANFSNIDRNSTNTSRQNDYLPLGQEFDVAYLDGHSITI